MNNSGKKMRSGLFITVLIAGIPLTAGADDTKNKIETSGILEPVILNAKQRFNDIEKIPFSVSKIRHDTIVKTDVTDTRSLVRQVPNVNYSDSGLLFANTITMRGVGSSSALIFPSVNYYVDGVPIPTRMFDMPFGDVEKIAIFHGPQGTTGGLNSQAGSIDIVTRAPSPVATAVPVWFLVLMDARKVIFPMKDQSTNKYPGEQPRRFTTMTAISITINGLRQTYYHQ